MLDRRDWQWHTTGRDGQVLDRGFPEHTFVLIIYHIADASTCISSPTDATADNVGEGGTIGTRMSFAVYWAVVVSDVFPQEPTGGCRRPL